MVDAPVSGAEIGAQQAELVFMVGGETAAVERVRPLLEVLGKAIFHLGPIGSGHAMKSINNLITAVTFLATAEGLSIGKSYGLDPAVMVEVLNVSTGESWISRTPHCAAHSQPPVRRSFQARPDVKDIDIALKIAGEQRWSCRCRWPTRLSGNRRSGRSRRSSVSELVRALETRTGVQICS